MENVPGLRRAIIVEGESTVTVLEGRVAVIMWSSGASTIPIVVNLLRLGCPGVQILYQDREEDPKAELRDWLDLVELRSEEQLAIEDVVKKKGRYESSWIATVRRLEVKPTDFHPPKKT